MGDGWGLAPWKWERKPRTQNSLYFSIEDWSLLTNTAFRHSPPPLHPPLPGWPLPVAGTGCRHNTIEALSLGKAAAGAAGRRATLERIEGRSWDAAPQEEAAEARQAGSHAGVA